MHWHHGVAFGDDNEGCTGVCIGSPAVRNVVEGGGARTEPDDPTINRLEYEKNNKQCQVVRGGLLRCSLPLLLL